ncbi:MAG: hypothetical protein EZS28_044566, partial [Streblomastix strix]
IVTIGNFGGVQDGDRYNAGTAGGSSIQNSGAVDGTYKEFFDAPQYASTIGFDGSDFPGQFYREGTSLSYVDTEFYKITKDSKKQINILGWKLNLKRMCLKMADVRKEELRFELKRFIRLTEIVVPIQFKYLVQIIVKLNFLRVQVGETSQYHNKRILQRQDQ